MTTSGAAERLGFTRQTLANWRKQGKGPPYYALDGVHYYESEDLDAWLKGCRVVPGAPPAGPDATPAGAAT